MIDTGDKRGPILLDVDVGAQLSVVPLKDVKYHCYVIAAAAAWPRFAVAYGDHRIAICELNRTGKELSLSRRDAETDHRPRVTALECSRDGRRLFAGGSDIRISVFSC